MKKQTRNRARAFAKAKPATRKGAAEPDRVERGRGDERLGKDLYQPQRLADFS